MCERSLRSGPSMAGTHTPVLEIRSFLVFSLLLIVLFLPLHTAEPARRGGSQNISSSSTRSAMRTTRPNRVGTAVARRPLFRSRRAALPHPAPALGDDAQARVDRDV